MKKIITILSVMFISLSVYANDIYINQSGATLDLDVTQDGQNNTVVVLQLLLVVMVPQQTWRLHKLVIVCHDF